MNQVAIIGVGDMGGAIADGLLRSGMAPASLILANPHTDRLARYAALGVRVTSDNVEAAIAADTIILGLKPGVIPEVTEEISHRINEEMPCKTFISVCPSVDLAELEKRLTVPGGTPEIAIAIPNTAAALCASMTFITASSPRGAEVAARLFSRLGAVEPIAPGELLAMTALGSCGIAFAMRYVRASMEAAVETGIKPSRAQQIISHTLRGAAALLLEPGSHPETEIDRVTTPGGITIRGLNAMEDAGFTQAVIAAYRATAH